MRNRNVPIWLALLLLVGVGSAMPGAAQASDISLQAVLIYASNDPASSDPRLSDIEPQLRKVLGFAHYSHYGQGNASASLPGSATIRLGRGYTLQVETSEAPRGRIRLQVNWRKGNQSLMSTSAVVSRGGAPAILGGPSHENGKLIVTLTAR